MMHDSVCAMWQFKFGEYLNTMRFWNFVAVACVAATIVAPVRAQEKSEKSTDFVQEIPGTLVTFEMKVVPGVKGGGRNGDN